MDPNPPSSPISLYSIIDSLELNPALKALLKYSLYGRRPRRDLFDNVSYHYYITYIEPKLSLVLRGKDIVIRGKRYVDRYVRTHSLAIFVSPSYVIYEFKFNTKECYEHYGSCYDRSISHYRYIFGVDNGKIFVNRVSSSPDMYDASMKIDDKIELRLVGDHAMRGVMGYHVDYGDVEDVTINLEPDTVVTATVRIQGDIVLALEPISRLLDHVGLDGIIRHVRLLLIDMINRILLDNGLSAVIWGNSVVLENVAPRRKAHIYQHKVLDLLARELKELLGDINVSVNEYNHEIGLSHSDFAGFIIRVRTMRSGYGNPYIHILIEVDHDSWHSRNSNSLVIALQNELLKEFESIPFTNVEFSLDNHHIRITNTKPLSFIYRPSKQPLTLNENIISVTNPLTFIVTPDSVLELSHKEHGFKTVRFRNKYIITFRHVNIHTEYLNERNRVILRNLKL